MEPIELLYIALGMGLIPYLFGRLVYKVMKIKEDNNSFSHWYTGIMSLSIISISLYVTYYLLTTFIVNLIK